jgi:hypothetical protein
MFFRSRLNQWHEIPSTLPDGIPVFVECSITCCRHHNHRTPLTIFSVTCNLRQNFRSNTDSYRQIWVLKPLFDGFNPIDMPRTIFWSTIPGPNRSRRKAWQKAMFESLVPKLSVSPKLGGRSQFPAFHFLIWPKIESLKER